VAIQNWSTTAADNDDADATISWVENQVPSTVNNSARAMMAAVAAWRDAMGGAKTSGGAANAYTLTTGLSLAAYSNGLLLAMEANHTNSGASTIAIDGLSAKNLKTTTGAALGSGAITSGGIYLLVYESGADFVQVLNPGGDSSIAATLTAISLLAVTDGNVIVGNGATWVAESGATARASLGAAAASQTAEGICGPILGSLSNRDYVLVLKAPHAGTITETTTKSTSGTATGTFKINSTALGGTANSISSAEQSRAHTTNNAFVAGDDIVLTVSANASCVDCYITITYTRTLL
jgi:hypothetical protein